MLKNGKKKMYSLFRKWRAGAVNLFFPAFCHNCQGKLKSGGERYFCTPCWDSIKFIENHCARCGLPLHTPSPLPLCGGCRQKPPPFRQARSLGLYEGVLKKAVHLFKYGGKAGLGEELARLMSAHWTRHWPGREYDSIIPVPLHPKRLREREFNQSFILADRLGKRLGIPIEADRLRRTVFHPPQAGLNKRERLLNIKGCFSLTPKETLQNKKILLIDDVYTTGATIRECSRLLTAAGTGAVDIYTIART